MKLKVLGQPHDEVPNTADQRYKHYKANEDGVILGNGRLFRKNFGETGSVKYYQILIPKQLINEVLWSWQGEFGKHPGITKAITAYREKYCLPKMAPLTREWVISCEQCFRESRTDRSYTRPPLQNLNEHITAPGDAMQNDLVAELPPSGSYENFVTAMDVFSRYSLCHATSNQDAKKLLKMELTS